MPEFLRGWNTEAYGEVDEVFLFSPAVKLNSPLELFSVVPLFLPHVAWRHLSALLVEGGAGSRRILLIPTTHCAPAARRRTFDSHCFGRPIEKYIDLQEISVAVASVFFCSS